MRQFLITLRPVVLDLLGVLVFAALYALNTPLPVATGAGAMGAGAVMAWQIVRRRPVAVLQWVSLALVGAAAAATLFTNDPRFMMAKPSFVYAAIGAVMLRPGWMNRYVPPRAQAVLGDWILRFGYSWAGLMIAIALLNLVIALAFASCWAAFTATVPSLAPGLLFLIQYIVLKAVARRRTPLARNLSPAR